MSCDDYTVSSSEDWNDMEEEMPFVKDEVQDLNVERPVKGLKKSKMRKR